MPIPDNIVENLRETDKVIMTDADSIKFKSKIYTEKCVHSKPKGLWYGMGDSWIDWVRHEMPTWECNNLFKLDLDESKIIKLNNEEVIRGQDAGTDSTFQYLVMKDKCLIIPITSILWMYNTDKEEKPDEKYNK